MGKIFNVSGDCKPGLHYMVDISLFGYDLIKTDRLYI